MGKKSAPKADDAVAHLNKLLKDALSAGEAIKSTFGTKADLGETKNLLESLQNLLVKRNYVEIFGYKSQEKLLRTKVSYFWSMEKKWHRDDWEEKYEECRKIAEDVNEWIQKLWLLIMSDNDADLGVAVDCLAVCRTTADEVNTEDACIRESQSRIKDSEGNVIFDGSSDDSLFTWMGRELLVLSYIRKLPIQAIYNRLDKLGIVAEVVEYCRPAEGEKSQDQWNKHWSKPMKEAASIICSREESDSGEGSDYVEE